LEVTWDCWGGGAGRNRKGVLGFGVQGELEPTHLIATPSYDVNILIGIEPHYSHASTIWQMHVCTYVRGEEVLCMWHNGDSRRLLDQLPEK
jgi:hypothetical protein